MTYKSNPKEPWKFREIFGSVYLASIIIFGNFTFLHLVIWNNINHEIIIDSCEALGALLFISGIIWVGQRLKQKYTL